MAPQTPLRKRLTAIKEASLQRLRPILMTSACTILGLIPLAFATGEGCNQRIAMGTAVVGGMIVSTILTMYIVPAIYSYISTERHARKAVAVQGGKAAQEKGKETEPES